MTKQALKTLKWFSLESGNWDTIILTIEGTTKTVHFEHRDFNTEQQAFSWLEANGYIERIKE